MACLTSISGVLRHLFAVRSEESESGQAYARCDSFGSKMTVFINETLARGLTDRFFDDFSTEISGPFVKICIDELEVHQARKVGESGSGLRGSTGALFDRFLRRWIQGKAVLRNDEYTKS